jgi:superfamily I DNA/RNA helicase
MKGLDAEAVFVLGLDEWERKHPSSDVRSLAYVACTRARNSISRSNVFLCLIWKWNPRQEVAAKCEAFRRQGEITLSP